MKSKKTEKITVEILATKLDKLVKVVAEGFSGVHRELEKKADKTDILEVQGDIANLANTTKLGFDEVHEKLDTKASKSDIDGIKQRLSNLDYRFDTVATHERRILRLEKEASIA